MINKFSHLLHPKQLFYISFIAWLIPVILIELFSINRHIVEDLVNNPVPVLPLLALISTFGLYFHTISCAYKKKQWIHFWITLLFFPYMWIYYIFFYEKGFNLAKKISR